jgi:ribonuclease Z
VLTLPLEREGRGKELSLNDLRDAVTITPGQKIVYVADCRFSGGNARRIIQLAGGADLFFCEAGFLGRDRERAEKMGHLTARRAGELARQAKAKKLQVFHFSPKYEKEAALLNCEAEEAFGG